MTPSKEAGLRKLRRQSSHWDGNRGLSAWMRLGCGSKMHGTGFLPVPREPTWRQKIHLPESQTAQVKKAGVLKDPLFLPKGHRGGISVNSTQNNLEVQNRAREQVADIEVDGGSNLEKALPQTVHYRYPGLPRTHLLSAKYTFCSCLRLWPLAVMLGLQTVPSSRLLFKAECMCALKICI